MHHPAQYEARAKIKMSDARRQSAVWRQQQRIRRMQNPRRGLALTALRPKLTRIILITRGTLRNLMLHRRTREAQPAAPVATDL